jgi:hypothetical protein
MSSKLSPQRPRVARRPWHLVTEGEDRTTCAKPSAGAERHNELSSRDLPHVRGADAGPGRTDRPVPQKDIRGFGDCAYRLGYLLAALEDLAEKIEDHAQEHARG